MARMIGLFAGILFIVIVTIVACKPAEREKTVRKKSKTYLKEKYDKTFKVKKFTQYFHGGNFNYVTELVMHPSDDPQLEFTLNYSEKRKKVFSENYKRKLWEQQIIEEIRPIIEKHYLQPTITGLLFENAHHVMNTNDMPFYKNYAEMLQHAQLPALSLELKIKDEPEKQNERLNGIVELCEFLSTKEWVKVEFEIYFCKAAYFTEAEKLLASRNLDALDALINQQLLFKYTHKDTLPQVADLSPLLYAYKKDTLYSTNKAVFEQAQQLSNEGKTDEASDLYQQIINSVSTYRFDHYPPSQSAYSVESAFALAELAEKKNNTDRANRWYRYVLEKLEYDSGLFKEGITSYEEAARNKLGQIETTD